MILDGKEPNRNPQNIVMNTMKSLIIKLHESITDLSTQCNRLEKKLETRTNELDSYISENENQINKLKEQIGETKKRIEDFEEKLLEVTDFLKETKLTWGVWKKCLIFMKEFPGHIVAFVGAVMAIVMYLSKFLGF